jgi:hypothetical protein
MCKGPVGLGANRNLIFLLLILIRFLGGKDREKEWLFSISGKFLSNPAFRLRTVALFENQHKKKKGVA